MAKPLALMRRIAAMSEHEIRTRGMMAIRQRLDAWEARWGRNPLHADYSHWSGIIPRFFFDTDEAATLAAEIRRRLPVECESVIESAKQIQARRFDLLGYRGLTFGNGEIEWHRDAVHGIAAPDTPWFRVPYLDFRRTGDHKVIWELSRHQHLMLLARAWLYTGDSEFLRTLQSIWEDWRRANPYPMGINWASTLEIAFRCLSWIWIDQLTRDSADLPDSFRTKLREGIGECAVYTERYLSTYFAPNTHLLGEMLALFFVGVLYPGFEKAQFWRDLGWRGLQQESVRQVRADGFHFEQSVYYHVYALDMFLHARILATRSSILIPEKYDQTLRLMAEGLATISAGGKAPRFGDDDGGRLFDGRRNRTEHMLDPLPTAAILYGRGDWKTAAGNLREETMWLLGVDGMHVFDQLSAAPSVPRSCAFPTSGYYTIASNNGVAIIDAGPHGWGNGGHGHADALSVQLIAGGRDWLTDAGTGSYPREKPERDLFRGTAAHNTLEVDGQSQAEPLGSFSWKSHPATQVHRWHVGEKIVLFHGSHDGYSRLNPPVTHERWMIGWPDDLWMVTDRASGKGVHRLDIRWHLAPESALAPADSTGTWRVTYGQENMEILASANEGWNATCETAACSPSYGAVISAPVLHFSREGALPANFVTFFALNKVRQVSAHKLPAEGANVYLCTIGESRRWIALAERPGVWRCGGLESDAEILIIESSASAIQHVLISGASVVSLDGNPLRLEGATGGIWEFVAGDETGPSLTFANATALLQVLEHLLESVRSSVSSAPPETGHSQ
jgi:hypothetical protein